MSSTEIFQRCIRCVMDTSDPKITFDELGVCNHCRDFDSITSKNWLPNDDGAKLLDKIYKKIRREGSNKDYDCILGLSGGVDSSFLAIKVKEAGLKPLVIHVDGGWNSELAVQNIENIVKYCDWHLHTIVIDWDEMRDLQLAYLKSGIANQDVPQDHAFFASLYHFATKHKIRYVINGANIATEAVFPKSWHWSAMDAINLRAIHKKFGTRKLRKYKTISFGKLYILYPLVKGMRTVQPLNLMPYDKRCALQELKDKIGYKEYDRKHGESIFTKFFQNYWLPSRYGYDKRKMHLSSMILSGQLTREEAIVELAKPLYDARELADEKEYLAKKLGVDLEEFEKILCMPLHSYADFPNMKSRFDLMKKAQRLVLRMTNRRLSFYS